MDYTGKALEALGKALSEKDSEISMLKWERDSLNAKIKELETKTVIETTVTTTVTQERMV